MFLLKKKLKIINQRQILINYFNKLHDGIDCKVPKSMEINDFCNMIKNIKNGDHIEIYESIDNNSFVKPYIDLDLKNYEELNFSKTMDAIKSL